MTFLRESGFKMRQRLFNRIQNGWNGMHRREKRPQFLFAQKKFIIRLFFDLPDRCLSELLPPSMCLSNILHIKLYYNADFLLALSLSLFLFGVTKPVSGYKGWLKGGRTSQCEEEKQTCSSGWDTSRLAWVTKYAFFSYFCLRFAVCACVVSCCLSYIS